MNIHKTTLTATMLAASIGLGVPTAAAAPEAAPETVGFHTTVEGDAVVTTLERGTTLRDEPGTSQYAPYVPGQAAAPAAN